MMIESSSSSDTGTLFDCRVERVDCWGVFSLPKSSPPRSWANSDTDILLLGWACTRPALTSFSNMGDGACSRWGIGTFCMIAVVDEGRLDAGTHSSDAVFVLAFPSSSVSSISSDVEGVAHLPVTTVVLRFGRKAEWPGPEGAAKRLSFPWTLPRPASGDAAWERSDSRSSMRSSMGSSSDEPSPFGCYAGGSLGMKILDHHFTCL